MAPKSKDVKGKVVKQINGDYSAVLPTYIDFEDIFAALDEIRQGNVHGYGYNEPQKTDEDPPPKERPTALWANSPFKDKKGELGAGWGAIFPYIMEETAPKKQPMPTRVIGEPRIKRTNCVTATFNALAMVLARGQKDDGDRLTPFTRNGRLSMEAYRLWFVIGATPPEAGVAALVRHNLGVWVDSKKIRRGDCLMIDWQWKLGSHCTYCWDAASDGDETFVQAISSQTSTNGVGVIVSEETLTAYGKLELVTRANNKVNQWVMTLPRDKPWLTTHEAREFYRRHGHFFREHGDFKKGDNGILIDRYFAGRFHRLFPRYPIELGESIEVSTVQGGHDDDVAHHRTRESTSAVYFENNERLAGQPRKGGFFPIAASRSWHGGIHLYPEKGKDGVHAPFDGVLVAARLATPGNKSRFGDAGFVLIKTRLKIRGKEQEFFTLLAHLAPPKDDEKEIPWLDEVRHIPPEDDHRWQRDWEKKKRYYGILDPPEYQGPNARKGDAPDGTLNFYEKKSTDSKVKGSLQKGDVVEAVELMDKSGWAHVKGLDGDLAGQDGWVQAEGRLERVYTHSLDAKRRDARTQLFLGNVVDLSTLDRKIVVRTGELVGRTGEVGGEAAIHFQVFSKELIPVNFSPDHADGKEKAKADLEDTDSGLYIDRKKFTDVFFKKLEEATKADGDSPAQQTHLVKGPTAKDDDVILAQEICRYYSDSVLRQKMRTLVTRHHSEWGDAIDWSQMDSAPQWKHVPAAQLQAWKDEVKKLQWWSKGFLSAAGLPDDQICHHYHPVSFLGWIDYERENDKDGSLHASVFELNHQD